MFIHWAKKMKLRVLLFSDSTFRLTFNVFISNANIDYVFDTDRFSGLLVDP